MPTIRAGLQTFSKANLGVVIILTTVLMVAAIRRSMVDGVVSGIGVAVILLIWIAFSYKGIMHGLFGIQTAIAIGVGLLLLADYFTPNQTREWLRDAVSVLACGYVLISLSAIFRGWLARRDVKKSDRLG